MTCIFCINGEKLHIDQLSTKLSIRHLLRNTSALQYQKVTGVKNLISCMIIIFKNLYFRKIQKEPIAKLAEFNYKLLHNLLVTNKDLNKWVNNNLKIVRYVILWRIGNILYVLVILLSLFGKNLKKSLSENNMETFSARL